MSKYQNGKIYKIIDKTNNKIYIGSTIKTLKERLSGHERNYKRYLNDKDRYTSSFEIIKNNNYCIVMIEDYPCETKTELEKREGFFIKSIECVNKKVAGRTDAQYYKDNKKEIKEHAIQYYEANRQKALEQQKQYYEQNKTEIQNNKKQPLVCTCGSEIQKTEKARHERSQKHIKFVQEQQLQSV